MPPVCAGDVMGHIRGKKLAQNNSKPLKASIRLALMHCFSVSCFFVKWRNAKEGRGAWMGQKITANLRKLS